MTRKKKSLGVMVSRTCSSLILTLMAGMWAAPAAGSEPAAFDVTQIPIEQLVETEYIPASRIARQISDAPFAVSIITAQDIRDYGYRTLSEILKSMRGFYVTSSLSYDYLGGRGFGEPGDYAGRIMLMIDGYTTNDNVFHQIFIGHDGFLDVELIERVEFIPGPGSTTYGNTAFLGVINIVTKRGRDFSGAQVAAGFGNESLKQRSQRFTYGKQLENGAEILLSASRYEDDGRNLRLPTLPGMEDQVFRHEKKTGGERIFFKGSFEGWSLEAAHARHALSGSAYFFSGEVASEVGNIVPSVDANSFVSLKHDARLQRDLDASAHVYYGQYRYSAGYRYPAPETEEVTDYSQKSVGRWWGADIKFVGNWFDRHRLLFGGEYRHDIRQAFTDTYSSSEPLFDTSARILSAYVQDEYRATDSLTLIPGLRYDRHSAIGGALSPRFAAIYQPWQASTFKLSHGRAFRTRTQWEESILISDPALTPLLTDPTLTTPSRREQVATSELVWQRQLTANSRLTASLYRSLVSKPVAQDYETLETSGQEIGFEYAGGAGTRVGMSLTRQRIGTDQGREPYNTPHWLCKLNIAQPLFQNLMTAGLSVQGIGWRSAENGATVKAGTVANLTLSSSRLIKDANVSLTIRNLFNRQLLDVVNPNSVNAETMPLPCRNLWLQLEYNFK